jgi:hypothetical protein
MPSDVASRPVVTKTKWIEPTDPAWTEVKCIAVEMFGPGGWRMARVLWQRWDQFQQRGVGRPQGLPRPKKIHPSPKL